MKVVVRIRLRFAMVLAVVNNMRSLNAEMLVTVVVKPVVVYMYLVSMYPLYVVVDNESGVYSLLADRCYRVSDL